MVTIVGVIVVLVAIVLILAAGRPGTFRLERSTTVNAPPEKVFPHLENFRGWEAWSPWEGLDPDLKRRHSGASSGRGAIYDWEGNKQVGTGRMEVLEAEAPHRLLIQLDFLKPFEAHNRAEFTLERRGNTTHLTWAMFGPQAFPMKVMSLFVSMDSMVGKDFEKGLARLKAVAEA